MKSAAQVEQAKTKPRSLLIDAVRGMAISLVALGHTNQGIDHRHWWGSSAGVGQRLDVTIYAFHMPAFFFMSGIFLAASVAKRGPGRFTMERMRTLLYPYVLWSMLSEGSVHVLSRFVHQNPMTLRQWLYITAIGSGIWFLPALFFCLMVGMVLRKLPGAAIVAIAVLAFYLVPETGVTFVDMGIQFMPFVAGGMWLGRGYEELEELPRWAAVVLTAVLLALLLVETQRPWTTYRNEVLLGGVIGTAMLLTLARTLGRSRAARLLAWAGEASIAIYLMGEYGQALMRQMLVWVHVTEPYVQLIVPTLIAVVVPAWVYQHRVRLRLEWLFVAPFGKLRPAARAARGPAA